MKTFWTTVGALFVLGVSVSGIVWNETMQHQKTAYHQGTPIYVNQELRDNNTELIAELRLIRADIRRLREAVIALPAETPALKGGLVCWRSTRLWATTARP